MPPTFGGILGFVASRSLSSKIARNACDFCYLATHAMYHFAEIFLKPKFVQQSAAQLLNPFQNRWNFIFSILFVYWPSKTNYISTKYKFILEICAADCCTIIYTIDRF